jgi:hypothetical protein
MTSSTLRPFVYGAAVIAVLIAPRATYAQDSIAAARDLYASAAYDDALAVLNRMDPSRSQPSDRTVINQYRAYCLVALRRNGEAEQAIEALLSDQPLYHPPAAEASPRLVAAFATVRQRVLPVILQQKYARAKAAFDRKEYGPAIVEFDQILQILSDADLADAGKRPPLSDLQTLASGFRDLAVRAATPPPAAAPVAPAAAPAAQVPIVAANRIYNATDAGVLPAVTLRQELPPFPRDTIMTGHGVLEVVINEAGMVDSAAMRSPINPRYDALVINATKAWKFKPATLNGTPVRFRKYISINVKPGS